MFAATKRMSPNSSSRSVVAFGPGKLPDLLLQFGQRSIDVWPVEANPPGASLQRLGGSQRREGGRDTGENAASGLFVLLDLLPVLGDGLSRCDRGVTEHVGVAANQLAAD